MNLLQIPSVQVMKTVELKCASIDRGSGLRASFALNMALKLLTQR